jgi:glutathione S-transferase
LHKGVEFVVHPVRITDKDAIGFSGQTKVPIIKHGDNVVSDSWSIATYLERAFPDRPSLFGGDMGEALTQFFNLWVDREVIPMIIPFLMRDVLDCVDGADAEYHRGQMEKVFKQRLEELYEQREKSIPLFRRKLQLVRKLLDGRKFLAGPGPGYADYILFGVVQWARVVSLQEIFEPGDIMSTWFDRVLDLYDMEGRKQLSRAERMMAA